MLADITYDAAVIGAGPAGSSAALHLASAGLNVCLIEKKTFPREILCGEFISREVTNTLTSLGLFDEFKELGANPIHSFKFIFKNGKALSSRLTFTGFGLKRGVFDTFIFSRALKAGASVLQPAEVKAVKRLNGLYILYVAAHEGLIKLQSRNVIAAYGKQNPLDKDLNRSFAGFKSRINGVKLHVPAEYLTDYPEDEIHIYSGDGIYCGVNKVDRGIVTVCFLEDRKSYEAPPKMHLRDLIIASRRFREIFTDEIFDFISSAPVYGTGNIYFGKKNPVENGILMAGDSAQVIAPLTGDGIAMAFQSAKLASEAVIQKHLGYFSGEQAEEFYIKEWRKLFSRRVGTAYLIQRTILNPLLAEAAYITAKMFPGILKYLINSTRG